MAEILMPALGADMESGVVAEWRIAPGDRVARGDVVAVIETDKGDIEIESYVEGVVRELLAPVGARLDVGAPLARLEGEAPGPRATPGARRAAAARGIALGDVAGTGPRGAITEEDVAAAAGAERPSAGAPPGPPEAARAEALRRATGDLMARSKREIPHYYLEHRVDAGPLTDHVAARNQGRPPASRLVLTPFIARAVALAAREVPEMNGHWRDGRFAPSDAVHVGIAIALRGGGVVAPALHDADRTRAEDLMEALRGLVERTRAGVMRSSEMADATITLSNLGDRSVELVHGVIHPPQVALVGAGAPLPRPWAEGERVVVRPVIALSLAGDHRVSEGRRGGRFLRAVAELLAEPDAL